MNPTFRIPASLGLSLTAALVATLPARGADDIVIGFAVAQSGPVEPYDLGGTRMAQLFIEHINARGGILGRKLKAVFSDTKSDRAQGAKAGLDVVRQDAAVVFVSCDYDFGAPAALQAQKAGVISVSLCAGDPKMGVLGVGPLSFTASMAAQVEGAALADWGYTRQGYRNAYVLLDTTIEYDKSVCAGFEWLFPQKGGKIVGSDTFKNDDPSIATQISRLRATMSSGKVDAIMLCTYTPGGASATRQIRAAGIDLPLLNGVAMDGTYWLPSVPNLDNFYVAVQASIFGDPRPEVKALFDAYTARFGETPLNTHAFPSYAWLQLWAKAVTTAGTTDAKAVVAEMEKFRNEPTVLGPRTFTAALHIQNTIPIIINKISGGKGTVEEEWKGTPEIPVDVLYRQKK